MKGKASVVLLMAGIVFFLAGILLFAYNLHEQRSAGERSVAALEELSRIVPQIHPPVETETLSFAAPASSASPKDEASGEPEPVPIHKPEPLLPDAPVESEIPDHLLNPQMPMPQSEVQGVNYIGILSIPALGLRLPIAERLSDMTLRIAPCRYYGSAYTGDLVLAAHNYDVHFGSILHLRQGDSVQFVDMDGNEFKYIVAEVEILEADAVEEMIASDYALTLFTCTVGGRSRVTVRCEQQ